MTRIRFFVLLLSLGAACSSLADGLPIVHVDFVFHANTCRGYGATRLNHAERFARIVRDEYADRYQFIDWRTSAMLKRAKTEATLTVQFRAEDVRAGRARGVSYFIDYFRDGWIDGVKITGTGRVLSNIGETDPLYTWDEFDRPCEDPQFSTRLRKRIQDDIANFDPEIRASLLRYVPIGKRAPDLDDKHPTAVTLDLRWKALHAGRGSRIEMNVLGDVKAEMNSIGPHDRSIEDPPVCAKVVSFADVDTLNQENLRAALQPYRARTDVRLFMAHYVLDRDTHEFRPTGTTVVGNPE